MARETSIGVINIMLSQVKDKAWVPPKTFFKAPVKAQRKKDTVVAVPKEHCVTFGITQLLIDWVKHQRTGEKKLPSKGLSLEMQEYLGNNKRYGCVFPPCIDHLPAAKEDLQELEDFSFELSNEEFSLMAATLQIAACSSHPWAYQNSNLTQVMPSVASTFLALYHNKELVYKQFLGQDLVWELYSKMTTILQDISHHWKPWHGITAANRVSSRDQHVPTTREGYTINPIVGVAITQSAAEVDMKYRKGIAAIWKIVQEMCSIQVPTDDESDEEEDKEDGSQSRKLGTKVVQATEDYFQVTDLRYLSMCYLLQLWLLFSMKVLARESAHARYKYDKQHEPISDLARSKLQNILSERLGWQAPEDDIQLTDRQRLQQYGAMELTDILTQKVKKMPTAHSEHLRIRKQERKQAMLEEAALKRKEKKQYQGYKGKGKAPVVDLDSDSDVTMEPTPSPLPPPLNQLSRQQGEASTSQITKRGRSKVSTKDGEAEAGDQDEESEEEMTAHPSKRLKMNENEGVAAQGGEEVQDTEGPPSPPGVRNV